MMPITMAGIGEKCKIQKIGGNEPVFRRSTMKVPTFSILPMHFRLLKYLKRLDFTGKFNVLTGHFFIENFFRYVV